MCVCGLRGHCCLAASKAGAQFLLPEKAGLTPLILKEKELFKSATPLGAFRKLPNSTGHHLWLIGVLPLGKCQQKDQRVLLPSLRGAGRAKGSPAPSSS